MTQIHWLLPANLLTESIAVMRPHGAKGSEGLALWLGTAQGSRIEVTHLVEVFGPGFVTTPLYMNLSLRAMSALTDLADRLGTYLVGQIHSHPENFLDLSDLDIRQGIRIPDYLSLVCPYYAQRPLNDYANCGVHVFEGLRYRRLSQTEISKRLLVGNASVTKIKCEVPA